MKWLKYMMLGTLALMLIVGWSGYFYLKSIGIIPRADYDAVAPQIPDFQRPAVLVLNKANGFVHEEAIPAADAMFRQIARDSGWDIFITDNAASHNAADLQRFAAVVWNNVSGDVLTEQQRADFRAWLEAGGGWLGIHGSGGDPSYQWPWYPQTLIGAQFVGHTMNPQFQDADVLVAEPPADVTAHLPARWRIANEEWYAFDSSPRAKGYEILLVMDESSYSTSGKSFFGTDRMEGEHPIAWRHQVGEGRVFYSAIGHQAATYSIPAYREFLARGLEWVAGP